jgi:hypothetical protein
MYIENWKNLLKNTVDYNYVGYEIIVREIKGQFLRYSFKREFIIKVGFSLSFTLKYIALNDKKYLKVRLDNDPYVYLLKYSMEQSPP